MIRVRVFKTADVFVGANRRVGFKYSLKFYCHRLDSCSYSFDSNFGDVSLLFRRLYKCFKF